MRPALHRAAAGIALAAAAWTCGVAPVAAAAPDAGANERRRIHAERAQAEARYVQQRQACQARFVVTSCVDDAAKARRDALERLRREENVLDEARRKQRAADRLAQIDANAARDAERAREAQSPDRRAANRAATQPRVKVRGSPHAEAPAARPVHAPRAPTSPALTPAEAARNEAAFEARRNAAQAHRDAVEQRNARRAVDGKPRAAPLPLPAAPP